MSYMLLCVHVLLCTHYIDGEVYMSRYVRIMQVVLCTCDVIVGNNTKSRGG